MSTIAYIPKSIQNWCDQSKITALYACAYDASPVSGPPGNNSTGPKTNHWVFYCVLADENEQGYKSIRLEPTPSGPNLSVTLVINLKTYLMTNRATTSFQLSTKNITFGQLIALITSKKYQNYQFTNGGQGCRYWIYCVTKLLKESEYLTNPAQADAGIEKLGKVWTSNGQLVTNGEQTGIQAGRFF
ncbi:MAG: hypothetical protein M1831_006525 [Alyxoria varia]|nr:MAG: hypothetical protein M1831_006525 [Alyxoria varia]